MLSFDGRSKNTFLLVIFQKQWPQLSKLRLALWTVIRESSFNCNASNL